MSYRRSKTASGGHTRRKRGPRPEKPPGTHVARSRGVHGAVEIGAGVLVAARPHLRHHASVVGGRAERARSAGATQLQAHAVRDQNVVSPSLTMQRGGKFTTTVRWIRSDIGLPQGAFVTNLGTMRVTYNFTPSRADAHPVQRSWTWRAERQEEAG